MFLDIPLDLQSALIDEPEGEIDNSLFDETKSFISSSKHIEKIEAAFARAKGLSF